MTNRPVILREGKSSGAVKTQHGGQCSQSQPDGDLRVVDRGSLNPFSVRSAVVLDPRTARYADGCEDSKRKREAEHENQTGLPGFLFLK